MIKYRQAARAVRALFRDPFDFVAIFQLVDSLAQSRFIRTHYGRLLATVPAETAAHLRDLTRRPVDFAALLQLPTHTFGHRYATFMNAHQLSNDSPMLAYPEIAEIFADDWMTLRFWKIHDMLHTILDFGPDVPAEMGLQAFQLRNLKEPYGALAMASLPLTTYFYGHPRRMLSEVARGWRLGGQAENLFFLPFEDLFAMDLADLRAQLGFRELIRPSKWSPSRSSLWSSLWSPNQSPNRSPNQSSNQSPNQSSM